MNNTEDDTFNRLRQHRERIVPPDDYPSNGEEWRIVQQLDDMWFDVEQQRPDGSWLAIWTYQTIEEARDCWNNH